jgi:hypothetical protein
VFIALTGSDEGLSGKTFAEAGFRTHMRKPPDMQLLRELLRTLDPHAKA